MQKIDDLLRSVNRVVKYQNKEWNKTFKEFPKDINGNDLNFHREIISNFASHIEEMNIEDFDWLILFDACDEGEQYYYVHASKYWDEYYFRNRERLHNYISSTRVDEVAYTNFLFNKAINLMPKYEKYVK